MYLLKFTVYTIHIVDIIIDAVAIIISAFSANKPLAIMPYKYTVYVHILYRLQVHGTSKMILTI